MNIATRIKQLSVSQGFRFLGLFLKYPLYLLPTLQATRTTITLCNERFGNSHHGSNRANAFRHALWNVLICQKVVKRNKNKKKSIHFTQKFTNLYEKVTQNARLDEAMDLHNNHIGIYYFEAEKEHTLKKWLCFLQKLAENAQKVASVEEIAQFPKQLVFIEE